MYPYDEPEYLGFVRDLRGDTDGAYTDLRTIAADWLEDRGEGERAAVIRDMVGGKGLKAPGRLLKTWFSLFGTVGGKTIVWQPNTATTHDGIIRFFEPDTEGEYGGPSDHIKVTMGFASSMLCRATVLVNYFDSIYPREPVGLVEVNWDHSPGGPIIGAAKREGRFVSYRCGGRDVKLEYADVASAVSHEQKLSEIVFGKRWPGVKFRVHM